MATTAERIRTALEVRGMRQFELAGLTGIGKSSISTYLSGAYVPKQKNLHKIAKVLGVSEAWLMGEDVPMERSDYKLNAGLMELDEGEVPVIFGDDIRDSVAEELNSLGYDVKLTSSDPCTSSTVIVLDRRSSIKAMFHNTDFVVKKGETPYDRARKISNTITGDILKKYSQLSKTDKEIVDLMLNRSQTKE